jgi:hypothetical protein
MARRFDFNDLLVGASINQLGQMFDLDRRTVTDRLKGISPSGKRGGHSIYKISDVAPMLINGYMREDEIDEKRRRMKASEEKDFWESQNKRLKFLESNGDLWRTEKVVEVFAVVFKQFRESIVVFIDNLEHESGLPPETIDKVKRFGDGLLVEVREKLLQMEVDDSDDHAGTSDGSSRLK